MKKHLLTAALMAILSPMVYAEDVRIPIGQDTQEWQGDMPRRGITKTAVESQFGSPDSVHGPSGQPPIYYWEYPDFTVYFESDHVIHTVVKQRSKS